VELPEEVDVSGLEPRMGFLSATAASTFPVSWMWLRWKNTPFALPGVAYAGQNLFTCSQDSQDR
jgi:hypothetical protein